MAAFRPTYAEVNLSSVQHNGQLLRKMASESAFFCPMVKAEAYGHGAVAVSQALAHSGVQNLGVALVEEGLKLRSAGIQNVQLLVFGFFSREAMAECRAANLTPVISRWEDFTSAVRESARGPLAIHLKFNTGMNRLGFAVSDAEVLAEQLRQSPNLQLLGLCTHFSDGEDYGLAEGVTSSQLERFKSVLPFFARWQPFAHVANSAALLAAGQRHTPMPWGVRPGIAVYGENPLALAPSGDADLRPTFQLKTQVAALQKVEPGGAVSYGRRWRAQRSSIVAVLPLGYADGWMRILTNRAQVLIHGQRVPTVGTVCMDYVMVDLTDLEPERPVNLGDEVVLIGRQGDAEITASEVAGWADTIPYEVFTSVSARVPRIYLSEEQVCE